MSENHFSREVATRVVSRRLQSSSPLDKLFETLSEMNPATNINLHKLSEFTYINCVRVLCYLSFA